MLRQPFENFLQRQYIRQKLFDFFPVILIELFLELYILRNYIYIVYIIFAQILPVSKSSQMVTFTFENGITATLRTSGTEPKIKYYTEFCAPPGKRYASSTVLPGCVYLEFSE